MKTQKIKIEVVKKILAIDDAEIMESIALFVNEQLGENFDSNPFFKQEDETQKGIETILKMVKEFK